MELYDLTQTTDMTPLFLGVALASSTAVHLARRVQRLGVETGHSRLLQARGGVAPLLVTQPWSVPEWV